MSRQAYIRRAFSCFSLLSPYRVIPFSRPLRNDGEKVRFYFWRSPHSEERSEIKNGQFRMAEDEILDEHCQVAVSKLSIFKLWVIAWIWRAIAIGLCRNLLNEFFKGNSLVIVAMRIPCNLPYSFQVYDYRESNKLLPFLRCSPAERINIINSNS